MTISARSGASWATGSTSLSVSLPSGVSAGDMLILTVGGKPYDATINTPTGWTLIGSQQTNGSTASGVDSGSVTWAVFYKKATADSVGEKVPEMGTAPEKLVVSVASVAASVPWIRTSPAKLVVSTESVPENVPVIVAPPPAEDGAVSPLVPMPTRS